ncbi:MULTISPECIES: SagB/ThcOx family dehydrogenase [Pyrobaculum]|uniref:SagB/ThcOx family dehydrogenase n=1 Tax=Pyrobaculum arsenaticum TaxID=121277 RepID=A0A7L4P831_9CREN|nr:SagB/ThcOx family dehydrogenase [Pyrobaculum arsenaticum]MCY0891662.1 SagB/ThcOx family dehydrogenase [Pyrobaculum arsenaticum]NYR15175.1 SagB/ThcOx family dehydrogenase [Pyrobaculum arsenaticum]
MRRRSFIKFLLSTPLGRLISGLLLTGAAAGVLYLDLQKTDVRRSEGALKAILLPYPKLSGLVSVEEALANRRSIRDYTEEPLTLEELSQLLWAAYGVSETRYGLRTAPSAGAQYPLELYALVGTNGVKTDKGYLAPGIYHYDPHSHSITLLKQGDFREDLYYAALEQRWVLTAPVSLIFTAVYSRTVRVYGERGRVRYVPMDLGHAGQNVYLQATALGLGTVAVGAFNDEEVARILGLSERETPLYIMPVGRPVSRYRLSEKELIDYIEKHRRR